MKLHHITVLAPLWALGMAHSALADSARLSGKGWYGSVYGTVSSLPGSALNETRTGAPVLAGQAQFASGTGFGGALGKRLGDGRYAMELAWDYQSAGLKSVGSQPLSGDYASNLFWLNGYRRFQTTGAWTPYVGAGIAYVQEIDMDIQRSGQQAEYSRHGGLGLQAIAGAHYALHPRWSLMADLKSMRIPKGPSKAAQAGHALNQAPSYKPLSLQVGLVYNF